MKNVRAPPSPAVRKPTNTAAAAAALAFPPNPLPPLPQPTSQRQYISIDSPSPSPQHIDSSSSPSPLSTPPGSISMEPSTSSGPIVPTGDPVPMEPHHLDADPRCTELVTRLFVSQGIPLSAVTDQSFVELVRYFNPDTVLPPEHVMTRGLEKHCKTIKPVANYQKCLAPLCVTVEVVGGIDKYMVYSIHYFEDLYERKNVVYLKKMWLAVVDKDSIFITIRRAVNAYSYSNVKFSGLVCPNPDVYKMVCGSDICRTYYICFNFYLNKFVLNLMKIPELKQGLDNMRTFCRYLKSNVNVYAAWRRMQLAKRGELNMPDLDGDTWFSTARFLTCCLVLHDNIYDFCSTHGFPIPITDEKFLHLLFFQRLMCECVRHSEAVSGPENSISQVMPAVMAIRNFISISKPAEPYANAVRDAFTNSFSQVTRGSAKTRYDMATLMDPRYAYRTEIYAEEHWRNLELRAEEEFVNLDPVLEKCFYNDVGILDTDERLQTICQDFKTYRTFLQHHERPEEDENPNFWWGRRQTDMEFLAVLAREHLASPATAIDGEHHFNKGKGKFDRLTKTYQRPLVDDCLNVAGNYQVFRGKGYQQEKYRINPEMNDRLDCIESRILNQGMEVPEQKELKPEQVMMMEEQQMEEEKPPLAVEEIKEEPMPTAPPPKRRRGILRR